MDRHTCKLCFRRFHNGRALGGHMRSHVIAAAATSGLQTPPPASPPLSFASTLSADETKPLAAAAQGSLVYVLRENPKKSYKAEDHVYFAGIGGDSSLLVQDNGSDTESPRAAGAAPPVRRRRFKRSRRRAATPVIAVSGAQMTPDPEPASSVSNATAEEDVAISLMMLSRDSWTRSSRSESDSFVQHQHSAARLPSSEAEQDYDKYEDDNYEDDKMMDTDKVQPTTTTTKSSKSRFQCPACKKVFRSYQALGGHRASHKRVGTSCVSSISPPPPAPAPISNSMGPTTSSPHVLQQPQAVIHECPFCFRVFESGQALGGHKRAHLSASAASSIAFVPPMPQAKCADSFGMIDLNVPASFEDDYELSAVYDAEEFGSNNRR